MTRPTNMLFEIGATAWVCPEGYTEAQPVTILARRTVRAAWGKDRQVYDRTFYLTVAERTEWEAHRVFFTKAEAEAFGL